MIRTLALVICLAACQRSAPAAEPAMPSNTTEAPPPAPSTTTDPVTAIQVDDAERRIEEANQQIEILDAKLATAIDDVVNAQTDAERNDGSARIKLLQQEKANAYARRDAAKADFERAQRGE